MSSFDPESAFGSLEQQIGQDAYQASTEHHKAASETLRAQAEVMRANAELERKRQEALIPMYEGATFIMVVVFLFLIFAGIFTLVYMFKEMVL